MELNEIKKALYKEKPRAMFIRATSVSLTYRTMINDSDLYFLIPITDIGDAVFEQFMPAQQLIRWIVDTNVQ